MSQLLFSIAVFLAAHVVPSYQPLRQQLVDRMGERSFMSAYGVVSLVLFIWVIASYLNAPYVELWLMQTWMRHTVLLVMFFVCLLWVCAFSQPNPFSLGKGGKGYDPARPGIVALTRHPALVGLAGWSFSHILPNGDLASLLFFGTMGALSLYGPRSMVQKRQRQLGYERWQSLMDQTKGGWPQIGLMRWIATVLLYIGLVIAHEPVIGVAPIYWP